MHVDRFQTQRRRICSSERVGPFIAQTSTQHACGTSRGRLICCANECHPSARNALAVKKPLASPSAKLAKEERLFFVGFAAWREYACAPKISKIILLKFPIALLRFPSSPLHLTVADPNGISNQHALRQKDGRPTGRASGVFESDQAQARAAHRYPRVCGRPSRFHWKPQDTPCLLFHQHPRVGAFD